MSSSICVFLHFGVLRLVINSACASVEHQCLCRQEWETQPSVHTTRGVWTVWCFRRTGEGRHLTSRTALRPLWRREFAWRMKWLTVTTGVFTKNEGCVVGCISGIALEKESWWSRWRWWSGMNKKAYFFGWSFFADLNRGILIGGMDCFVLFWNLNIWI